jgi:hypothetical protein
VPAAAQCETEVLLGEGLPGVDGHVNAMTTWDPDGDGPASPVLVIGGAFRTAGKSDAHNLAYWDGSDWLAFGDGVSSRIDGTVYALTVYRGELIAAGDRFLENHAGVLRGAIVKWVGSLDVGNWEPLDAADPEFYGRFYSLVEFEDRLIVGGDFRAASEADYDELVRIASWNGSAWEGLGAGFDRRVNALAVYRGELIAGGRFSMTGTVQARAIAAWNGTQWRSLDGGLGRSAIPDVRALAVYRGRLIAGGMFDRAGGIPASSIASWNGEEWSSMALGVENGSVESLGVLNGHLYVGGTFNRAGGIDANRVAIWSVVGSNANRWVSLNEGVNALSSQTSDGTTVRSLVPFEGRMMVGGRFNTAGRVGASSIGEWGGGEWRALGAGFNASVSRLLMFDQKLIAAGGFTLQTADGHANGVASWDGEEWSPLGSGFDRDQGSSSVIDVTAMSKYRGELIVAGDFTHAGDVRVDGVARWNGSRWASVGTGVAIPSNQPYPYVYSLAQYGEELVAVGGFRQIGGVPSRGVAAWNGERWRTLEGVRNLSSLVGAIEFDGELYVGGVLQLDGRENKSRLVSWNGTRWRQLASRAGVRGGQLLAVHQGELYTARQTILNEIWVWNGASWRSIPLPAGSFVGSLTSVGGKLVISASFGFASWDGTEWRTIPSVRGGASFAMFRGEIVVGHGNRGGHSPFLSRFRLSEPLIARQPRNSPVVCVGSSFEFVVGPALGYQESTFQWRRDGIPLDGAGATERSFTLSPIVPSDAGTYDCVVSNDCGSTTSAAAELQLCPADFDCSGLVNGADVTAFHNAWLAQDPTADFDGDADVDSQDLVDFVAAWQAGCS